MLEPQSRRLLMESLQPPEGYRLDWAVGTTYSLDLIALLTAPVAFAFSDWQNRDGQPTADPLALLKAVRQYASRICLFCQGGKVQVPKTYQPLYASLEGSVVQANAPENGSFHPKLWFLRFKRKNAEDEDADHASVMYRLLCLSRNMTFDRCWDTLLCLEGALTDRTNAFSENHPLGQFVESLPGMSTRPLNSDWRKRLAQLAKEIRRVKFEVPVPFESLKFWPLGIPGAKPWPFPHRLDRLLVVTPFLGDGLMNDFAKRCSSIQVVSRDESLAKLQPQTFKRFEKAWILDDTANPEPGETEGGQASPSSQETVSESAGGNAPGDGQDLPLIGLHAKVYVIDRGWDASVLTGSANATRSAFGKNVEFLVELQGKRSLCGVETLLGKPSSGNQKRGSSLADLLVEYDPADREPEPDSEAEKFEWLVDEIAKSLAAAAPASRCEPIAETGSFSIHVSPTTAVDALDLQGCFLNIRPISLPASQFIPLELSRPCWVEFPRISLLGLTSFFAIEVESADGRLRRQFVLNIPLTNAPEQRHEAILKELLSDRERVLKFLLLMLADSGARDLSSFTDSMAGRDGTGTWTQSLLGATLFESLVRTLDRDPQRLDQVEDIIRDLRKSSEGSDLLPADLESIWEPIRVVRQQQKEQQLKRANRKQG